MSRENHPIFNALPKIIALRPTGNPLPLKALKKTPSVFQRGDSEAFQ